MPTAPPTFRDLGLTAEEALHGLQTAVAYELGLSGKSATRDPYDVSGTHAKDLRVGLNAVMCDHAALVDLLVTKGVVTLDEYVERQRRWANEELARYQARYPGVEFR